MKLARMAGPAVLVLATASAGAQTECFGGFILAADRDGRLAAFDAIGGSLVDPTFILDTRLGAPVHAVCTGFSVLVSDPGADAIYEYDFNGVYIRTIADGVGAMLNNPRGMAVEGEHVFVTIAGGALADTVQRFAFDGSGQTTWASPPGLDQPESIEFIEGTALVGNLGPGPGSVDQFTSAGDFGAALVASVGAPAQVSEGDAGGVLVADAGMEPGVRVYTSEGAPVAFYPRATPVRGVFRLVDGNILFTDDTGVHVLDPGSGGVTTVLMDTGFEKLGSVLFIPSAGPSAVLAVAGVMLAVSRRRRV